MISLIIVGLAFIWLGYETNWMRVRLPVGAYTPIIEQPNRKWQFLKYGDDALQPCFHCNLTCERRHRYNDLQFAWVIPARIVKIAGSTINFKEGCNLYRARLLKDIVKAQKSKAMPTYHKAIGSYDNRWLGDCEPSIELLVDGKVIANINGEYKRGVIKQALKPYTTKARVGKKVVTWDFGEADRIVSK